MRITALPCDQDPDDQRVVDDFIDGLERVRATRAPERGAHLMTYLHLSEDADFNVSQVEDVHGVQTRVRVVDGGHEVVMFLSDAVLARLLQRVTDSRMPRPRPAQRRR